MSKHIRATDPEGKHTAFCCKRYKERVGNWSCVCKIIRDFRAFEEDHAAEDCREDCFHE